MKVLPVATAKKKIAVFFGGRSPEHDVSILTGLQVFQALDPDLYDAFPVYISPRGEWFVGDALRSRDTYIPGASADESLTRVTLNFGDGEPPCLLVQARSMLQRPRRIPLDIAIPAFHGVCGEDGCIQGLFEAASIPYTGMRVLAASLFMDKIATKHLLASTSIQQLPFKAIRRPDSGLLITPDELASRYENQSFPCCVKPAHLGSSIGVAKVDDWQQVSDVLPAIFRLDPIAIIEPFVQNLVEYNVSVCRIDGEVRTSAIEQPKTNAVLLDFKEKYGAGGSKDGTKKPTQSEGMLSLTRDINPTLPTELEAKVRNWAVAAFEQAGGTGAPRIDFLCDRQTGQVWFNEVNPTPGSFAFFLWEAAQKATPFSSLLDALIAEGFALHRAQQLPADPVPEDARLFKRKA